MKSIYTFALLFCFGIFSAQAQKQEKIAWKSWGQLEQALKTEPKPVFLFFEADWCAYCKKIEREIFTKKQVIDKINQDYYAVRMNAESTDTIRFDGKAFVNKQAKTQRNGVHQLPLLLASRERKPFSLPATLILDKDFKMRSRIFEYYTSKELMLML